MREAQGREGVRKSDDKKTKGKALRRTRNKTEKKKKRTIKRGSGAKGRRKSQRLYNRNRKQKSQRRLKKKSYQKKRPNKGGSRKNKTNKRKQTIRNKKEKTTKFKFRENGQINRQNSPDDLDRTCMAKTESRLYRKAVNELRKAKRIERWFKKANTKVEKAMTLFNDGAIFFANCKIAEAAEIHEFLR